MNTPKLQHDPTSALNEAAMSLTDEGLRVLRDGRLEVHVLPSLGSRIFRIRWRGVDLLRSPNSVADALSDPWYWSSFWMVPWCNRIPNGLLQTPTGAIEIPANFEDGSAIHGEVHTLPWRVDGDVTKVDGTSNFPWKYRVELLVTVEEEVLEMTLKLINRDNEPMPYGVGWHPWFRSYGGDLQIRIPAKLRCEQNSELLAIEAPTSFGINSLGIRDLGVPKPNSHELYTGLDEPYADLAWPSHGIQARLTWSEELDHVLVYAANALDSVAIEPQSHATDGHRRWAHGDPGGVKELQPGQAITVKLQLSVDDYKDGATTNLDGHVHD